jgi:hypothetical protein
MMGFFMDFIDYLAISTSCLENQVMTWFRSLGNQAIAWCAIE